jgi:hypothetical protein
MESCRTNDRGIVALLASLLVLLALAACLGVATDGIVAADEDVGTTDEPPGTTFAQSPLSPPPTEPAGDPELDSDEACRAYWTDYYEDPDAADPWTKNAIETCVRNIHPDLDEDWYRVEGTIWTDGRGHYYIDLSAAEP